MNTHGPHFGIRSPVPAVDLDPFIIISHSRGKCTLEFVVINVLRYENPMLDGSCYTVSSDILSVFAPRILLKIELLYHMLLLPICAIFLYSKEQVPRVRTVVLLLTCPAGFVQVGWMADDVHVIGLFPHRSSSSYLPA
ncbi:hypothetical protein HBI56_138210 [Parastagonospora nodorum]|nr:hypothetical protein HBH53_119910 [Parastagonospora nodorum]KAH3970724.1 hypothetical protein HBH51_116300 [Parastagonospora nodorum]KAH3996543.1 hypothetical protein HBI10_157700 [Parastagonospora nodorum]KAH4018946.1 hypothetical protein HBI13_128380 [Parastagonospora nodorum]KAH4171162.1 hypothetical protein HBH43_094840 [Parastagonospora nodorum]